MLSASEFDIFAVTSLKMSPVTAAPSTDIPLSPKPRAKPAERPMIFDLLSASTSTLSEPRFAFSIVAFVSPLIVFTATAPPAATC